MVFRFAMKRLRSCAGIIFTKLTQDFCRQVVRKNRSDAFAKQGFFLLSGGKKTSQYVKRIPVRLLFLAVLAAVAMLLLMGCRDEPPNLVNSLEDVPGKVIGALSGTPSERLADELGDAWALSSGEELMVQLKAGFLDCVVMEQTAATELVSNTSGVRILGEPLLKYDLRFAVARENAELLAAVNSALEALHQNGTLRGLRDKYFAGRGYIYVAPEDVVPRPGSLSLAIPPDSPPFSYKDINGDLVGMDVEVARAVCDFLGVELEIIEYDAWELANAVWFGRADMALGWLPVEGEGLVNISEPYANAEHVVIVRR